MGRGHRVVGAADWGTVRAVEEWPTDLSALSTVPFNVNPFAFRRRSWEILDDRWDFRVAYACCTKQLPSVDNTPVIPFATAHSSSLITQKVWGPHLHMWSLFMTSDPILDRDLLRRFLIYFAKRSKATTVVFPAYMSKRPRALTIIVRSEPNYALLDYTLSWANFNIKRPRLSMPLFVKEGLLKYLWMKWIYSNLLISIVVLLIWQASNVLNTYRAFVYAF